MIALKNYIISEILYESAGRVVYRGVRRLDGAPVIIKTLRSKAPSLRDIERLHREYAIGRQLESPYVIRPEALETRESLPMLVYPDFGGQPLARLIGASIETGHFLEIAVQLAAALADIHRQGIVHRDIKPANVLITSHNGLEIKITDFGIAAPPARHPAVDADLIEGSLPYMAPEQTGRMDRGIDQRSDLYSLGVTFYQMLTGTLPCKAADPPEWVHCHIAREPKSPRQITPTILEPVAAIVMRLLAKQPEARYQSARGLLSDLRRCRGQWRSRGQIAKFALGADDASDLFLIPGKLYGRDEQLAGLSSAFERVTATGQPEFVLVSGYSGIGKSSLVQALAQSVIGEQGYFISGKFEEHRRDIPYAPLAWAFSALIRQILTESDERIQIWREELRQALGGNGRLITEIMPSIGPPPPLPRWRNWSTPRRPAILFLRSSF